MAQQLKHAQREQARIKKFPTPKIGDMVLVKAAKGSTNTTMPAFSNPMEVINILPVDDLKIKVRDENGQIYPTFIENIKIITDKAQKKHT